MNVTDEMLMAYADGELDVETSAAVARTIAADPALAAKLEKHRALRARLGAAFEPVLKEEVPERLVAAINAPMGTVTDLAAVRAAKAAKSAGNEKQEPSRRWLSLAASVVFGVLVGYFAFNVNYRTESANVADQIVDADGQILNDSLVAALTRGLASKPKESAAVRIGITYQSKSGEYCRSFSMTGLRNFAGVACHAKERRPDEWRMQMLLSIDAGSDTAYRQAASTIPPAVLAVMDRDIEGEPFDVEREAKAVADEWKQ